MSAPSLEICGLEEYEDGEARRVKEDWLLEENKLPVRGLYTVMFAREPQRSRGEAQKYSGEVVDIALCDNGIFYMVRFNLLDSNGQPARHRNDVFYDGYLMAKGGRNENEFAKVGYFRQDGQSPAYQQSQVAVGDEEGLHVLPAYEPVAA